MRAQDYDIPDDLLYTPEHEWVRIVAPTRVVMGVTEYAAKMLTDIVYVELPAPQSQVQQMQRMGTVESIKTVSDLFSGVSGTVLRVNEALKMRPELVNQAPYTEGWMLEVEPSSLEADRARLLPAARYAELITRLGQK